MDSKITDYFDIFKITVSLIFILLMLVYIGYHLFQGNIIKSLLLFLTLGYIIFLFIDRFESGFEFHGQIWSIIGLVGIASVLVKANANDEDYAEKNVQILKESIDMRYCPTHIQPNLEKRNRLNILKKNLLFKCGTQHITDASELTIDFMKAQYLEPITGLADNIYSDFYKDKKMNCIDTAKEIDKLCPNQYFLFIDL